jgi:hypothetical protein
MTARRCAELIGMRPSRCLVKVGSLYYVRFYLMKHNEGDKREEVVRPIPKIVAKCLISLKRMRRKMTKLCGDIENADSSIFAFPLFDGKLSKSVPQDLYLYRFSDYFEVPLNNDGERYYPGTHQLRRFFAILFFWAEGFGGLDTLRWFLGHIKVEHVWNYITENTPGAILNQVRAIYAGEKVKEGDSKVSGLAELLKLHYNISDFTLMNSNDIADYVEQELIHHNVKIEPIFFDTADGQRYEIIIKVTGKL